MAAVVTARHHTGRRSFLVGDDMIDRFVSYQGEKNCGGRLRTRNERRLWLSQCCLRFILHFCFN